LMRQGDDAARFGVDFDLAMIRILSRVVVRAERELSHAFRSARLSGNMNP
jgi:hypothetical protein